MNLTTNYYCYIENENKGWGHKARKIRFLEAFERDAKHGPANGRDRYGSIIPMSKQEIQEHKEFRRQEMLRNA
tara:strand:- start:120 stop:338 length:219 start_codon:yes stop_codon:yes gene_type:complete